VSCSGGQSGTKWRRCILKKAAHLFLEVGFLAEEPPAVAVASDEVGPVMGKEDAGRLLQLHDIQERADIQQVQRQA
jgi:hypothetical protein